ncbi:putative F-box domain, FBD domain, leucine-rich repeat domain, L domain-containing protein [Lupinus albus]|uniref:Putative F-box domain, FBD domain, leucine-rich repeat domain, L domain-containing protein n=1 Tax=Lupinus albus TaxID=3870 RepID=A0A6A4QFG8_LUPAL|nr:putative F-box domain, FBD domain, leucine-rich repeat domain, L domain-containing protein [Lupinus albus]
MIINRKRRKAYDEDVINQLPYGIPVAILSKLAIDEAARTSILSRKWRHLWTFFGDIKKASGRQLQMAMEIMYDAERQTYTNWINELLTSLKCSTLQALKFWFNVGSRCDIDKWVGFAIQKKWFQRLWKFSGPSLNLKCLELVRCWELRNLEISADNLESFKYYGPHLDIEFKSVPSLVEATFGGSYVEFIRESFLSQIKMLKLDITQNVPEVIYRFTQLPELKNLKHLELVACVNDDGITLNAFALLLKASPSLRRFTLKVFISLYPCFCFTSRSWSWLDFVGATSEVELLNYVLENAVELKKITIDTRLPTKPKLRPQGEHPNTWDHEQNRKRAWELQEKIPTGIEFVCL